MAEIDRYRRIDLVSPELMLLLIGLSLDAHGTSPKQIVPDHDATNDPAHGHQEGHSSDGYHALPIVS